MKIIYTIFAEFCDEMIFIDQLVLHKHAYIYKAFRLHSHTYGHIQTQMDLEYLQPLPRPI